MNRWIGNKCIFNDRVHNWFPLFPLWFRITAPRACAAPSTSSTWITAERWRVTTSGGCSTPSWWRWATRSSTSCARDSASSGGHASPTSNSSRASRWRRRRRDTSGSTRTSGRCRARQFASSSARIARRLALLPRANLADNNIVKIHLIIQHPSVW